MALESSVRQSLVLIFLPACEADALVAEVIAQTGILRGRRKRYLDSTVFDDAVATQDTVTSAGGCHAEGGRGGARCR